MHVNLQLADWAAASAVLDELKKDDEAAADRWRPYEAFVRLMQGDKPGAVAALEPILNRPMAEASGVSPMQARVVLMVAGDYPGLIEHLESLEKRTLLDEQGRALLCRAYAIETRWQDAAGVALGQFWRTPEVLDENLPWYRALVILSAEAPDAGAMVAADTKRPEDAALVTMVSRGWRDALPVACGGSRRRGA